MGNYKFKLSNMLPNAWFYKLRDMGNARNTRSKKKQQASPRTKESHHSYTRKSYYFTRELATMNERHYESQKNHSPKQTPRKSSKHKVRRRAMHVRSSHSSVSTGCGDRKKPRDQLLDVSASTSSPENETEFRSDNALPIESFDKMLSLSSSYVGRAGNSGDQDIIINIDKNSLTNKLDNVDSSDMLSGRGLPPIITKPLKCKDVKNTHVKRFSGNSPGVRLRLNSPRIAGRKIIQSQSQSRKSISSSSSSSRISFSLPSSYAVVKSSLDPQRDFKESMMEMIIENNIKSSKDLEDLLACYLSLNSDEYHGLIIRVFKEIWCDFTDIN